MISPKHEGFTLVELMITLAVAAILVTLVAPSFTSMLKNNRLTTGANSTLTAFTFARSEAVKRGVIINITAANPLAGNEWGGGWSMAIDGGATLRVFEALQAGTTLDSENDIVTFQYLPNGRATVTETFFLCDDRSGETGRRLEISTTGRISISDLDCD